MSTVGNWRGPNIVKDSLILYLDASSPNSYSVYLSGTTWKDISSNGNNGLLVNGPIFNNEGNLSSFSFDGVDDYVDTSDIPFRITNYDFSVEFIFYYNNSIYTIKTLLGKRNQNNPFNQWSFNISDGNPYGTGSGKVLTGFLRDDNNPNSQTFDRILTYTLPSAGIYHVIMRNNQTNAELWVNGVLMSTSSTVLSSGNFNISGYNFRLANVYASSYWDNKFYLARFYRKYLSSSEIQQNYLASLRYDSDALNFINVAGISDSTQQSAVNQLVIGLKTYGLWTKMRAVYPFVGGTASSHKWNLKDPQDTNSAFRLSFAGTWTHNNMGALPVSSAYAITYVTMVSMLPGDFSLGAYVNSTATSGYMIAVSQNNFSDYLGIVHESSNQKRGYVGRSSFSVVKTGLTSTTHQGFWGLSSISTTKKMLCSDGTFESITISNTTYFSSLSVYIGAITSESVPVSGYYDGRFAFSYISLGLTDTEITNLKTLVQNFNTTLGRQV